MTRELAKAISLIGGQTALANEISKYSKKPVSQRNVWSWLHRDGKVPAEMCIPLEKATGGKVRREHLRPDVFQEPQ